MSTLVEKEDFRVRRKRLADEFINAHAFVIEGLRCISGSILWEMPACEPQDGDSWGNWTFQRSNLTLQYHNGDPRWDREVDLERLTNPAEVLGYLAGYSGKSFTSTEDIGNLFLAIHDLGKAWYRKDTDVADKIRQRYAEAKVL